ncbi:MAG: flippase-like domain-containing protein [Chloroflexi bacterium]|nr:flippase-like domain-containing protein [Chloroflexota bacterium]
MLAAAVAIFVLFPQLIGFNRALSLLGRADPLFLTLALTAETLRYVVSAATTHVLARIFGRRVPLAPLTQAFFAGAAANRTFSTGGAPGMIVRALFLTRQGVDAGSVAVIYLIENVAGLFFGTLVLVMGLVSVANARLSGSLIGNVTFALAIGGPVCAVGAFWLYRRRAWVETSVHAVARGLNGVLTWFLGRPIYSAEQVQRALDQFYAGMPRARCAPRFVIPAFALNLVRHLSGAVALYCAFLAFGWPISPDILILVYTSASVLSTVSAVPGELAIMGGSWAVLTLSFGVPRDIAMMALLLSRTLAFWLPIPVGYLAFWNLRRQRYL